jgi:hypothetical protein
VQQGASCRRLPARARATGAATGDGRVRGQPPAASCTAFTKPLYMCSTGAVSPSALRRTISHATCLEMAVRRRLPSVGIPRVSWRHFRTRTQLGSSRARARIIMPSPCLPRHCKQPRTRPDDDAPFGAEIFSLAYPLLTRRRVALYRSG